MHPITCMALCTARCIGAEMALPLPLLVQEKSFSPHPPLYFLLVRFYILLNGAVSMLLLSTTLSVGEIHTETYQVLVLPSRDRRASAALCFIGGGAMES